jgi:hypothetical protein
MSDYTAVQKALADGAEPRMLCATCPWDRNCVSPPTMTSAEIDAQIAQATEMDDKRAEEARLAGQPAPMPTGALMTAMVVGGRDTMGQFCPVFALRLRSSGGRRVADLTRSAMQSWDDES